MMKRNILKWGALSLVILFAGVRLVFADPVTTYHRGDVNGDGNIDIADVTALVNKIHDGSLTVAGNADVNNDGSIDIVDVTMLQNYLHGTAFPLTARTLSFATAGEVSKTYGADDFTNVATLSAGTGSITYASDNTEVATVETSTGKVHIVGVGTTNITASSVADEYYSAPAEVSYTLTVGKAVASIITNPTPVPSDITYNGNSQIIANQGSAEGGELYYKITRENTKPAIDDTWITVNLFGKEAGTYYVWYYVKGDANHTSTEVNATAVQKTILKQEVTVSDINGVDKVFDGTTAATLDIDNVVLTMKHGSDDLGITGITGTFTDANVKGWGDSKEINISYASAELTGADKDNYYLASSGNQTIAYAKISRKPLTITAKAQTVTYGTDITQGVGQVTTDGLVDDDALTGITLTPSTSDVTSSGTIMPSAAIIATGTDNYTITYNKGNLTITAVAASGTAPTAVSSLLSYAGSAQTLFNAGTAVGGTMKYKVTTENTKPTSTEDFETTIAQQTNAGTYYLWYYVAGDDNHNDTEINTTAISKEVYKGNLSSLSVSMDDWTYGETASVPTVSGNTGGGEVTYKYKLRSEPNSTYTDSKPKNAGNYTVMASVAESTNYNWQEATTNFTISQREVTVSGITANNKEYDKNTDVTLNYETMTITGKVEGDDLTATASGYFQDADAGNDKTVEIYNITLNGSSAANYKMAKTGQQISTKATITKATPVVTPPAFVTNELTYTGNYQDLITAGSTTGGSLYYYFSTTNTTPSANDTNWGTRVDMGKDVGTYYVWYYVLGNKNYNSIAVTAISGTKTIAKASGAATLSITSVGYGTTGGEQTVTVTNNTGTVSAAVTSGSGCSVSVSGTTITISRTTTGNINATVTVTIAGSDNYNSTTETITVTGSAVSFASMASATTSSYIGKVICSNGHIHDNAKNAQDFGCIASGMITYIGNKNNANGDGAYSSSYNHGLAIALSDIVDTSGTPQSSTSYKQMDWTNANTAASKYTVSRPSASSGWMLPSAYQWERMLIGSGSTATYVDYASQTFNGFPYGNFRSNLESCITNAKGVYNVGSAYVYWLSTQYSSNTNYYWGYDFTQNSVSTPQFQLSSKTSKCNVRACFAF